MRSYPYATLVELCEQSMHAFVTFGDAWASVPRALKVSYNEFDLLWELDGAYFLEKLARVHQVRGVRGRAQGLLKRAAPILP